VKKLLALLLLVGVVGCGKPYDPVLGVPKLKLQRKIANAMVSKPFAFTGMMLGKLPARDQYLEVVLIWNGRERSSGILTMSGRILPSASRPFVVVLREQDYWDAVYGIRDVGAPREFDRMFGADDPMDDPRAQGDPTIKIEVRVYYTEPDSLLPHKFHRGKLIAKDYINVRLACPWCTSY
jgi:hypothetical protein